MKEILVIVSMNNQSNLYDVVFYITSYFMVVEKHLQFMKNLS